MRGWWKYAAALAVLLAVALAAVVWHDDEEPSRATGLTVTSAKAIKPAPAPLPPYRLAPTRRCLRAAGFAVTPVRSNDPRLRALGDLAQRSSFELRSGKQTIGLAFGDTRLLLSLLRVPRDPYRLEARRNALLMYRRSAGKEATAARACLRS